jgi:gamma-glutamyl:cysteine ligase YbdK (ATP-grasp superfamily)
MIYLCRKCNAYVGCHKNKPTISLGRLANAELRESKILAHEYLDNLWKRRISNEITKGHARGKAYKWLAQQMGIDSKHCHIGMFDVEDCKRVVELCKPYYKNKLN